MGIRLFVAGQPERADEGGSFPVAVRHGGAASFALGCAAVHPRHFRRSPALVDEDQTLGIEIGLRVEPGPTPTRYVRAVLLGSVRRLFFRVTPWRWKNRQTMLGRGR